MNFGEAIKEMKKGCTVRRPGWNGKNMYIYLDDYDDDFDPCINMWTAQSTAQRGWLASQADMLAEDWEITGREGV